MLLVPKTNPQLPACKKCTRHNGEHKCTTKLYSKKQNTTKEQQGTKIQQVLQPDPQKRKQLHKKATMSKLILNQSLKQTYSNLPMQQNPNSPGPIDNNLLGLRVQHQGMIRRDSILYPIYKPQQLRLRPRRNKQSLCSHGLSPRRTFDFHGVVI